MSRNGTETGRIERRRPTGDETNTEITRPNDMSHGNTYDLDGNKSFVEGEGEFTNDKENVSENKLPRATGVDDNDECPACGRAIQADKSGEYRNRIILDDEARSHADYEAAKLCADCWTYVAEFVRGGHR
jgi:hypothetical protein